MGRALVDHHKVILIDDAHVVEDLQVTARLNIVVDVIVLWLLVLLSQHFQIVPEVLVLRVVDLLSISLHVEISLVNIIILLRVDVVVVDCRMLVKVVLYFYLLSLSLVQHLLNSWTWRPEDAIVSEEISKVGVKIIVFLVHEAHHVLQNVHVDPWRHLLVRLGHLLRLLLLKRSFLRGWGRLLFLLSIVI